MKLVKLEQKGFAAVRRDIHGEHLWIDVSSFTLVRDSTEKKVRDMNNEIPAWGDANPVHDVVEATLTVEVKVYEDDS